MHENDRESLTRLANYGARGPLSLERLSELPDGRDVLECERCGGRMRVTAFVTDIGLAREVLGRLGLGNRPAPLATAAGPPQLALGFQS